MMCLLVGERFSFLKNIWGLYHEVCFSLVFANPGTVKAPWFLSVFITIVICPRRTCSRKGYVLGKRSQTELDQKAVSKVSNKITHSVSLDPS